MKNILRTQCYKTFLQNSGVSKFNTWNKHTGMDKYLYFEWQLYKLYKQYLDWRLYSLIATYYREIILERSNISWKQDIRFVGKFSDTVYQRKNVFTLLWIDGIKWRLRTWSPLPRVMACYLTVTGYCLNQHRLIIGEVMWYSSPGDNFTGNVQAIYLRHEFTIDWFKILAISSRG